MGRPFPLQYKLLEDLLGESVQQEGDMPLVQGCRLLVQGSPLVQGSSLVQESPLVQESRLGVVA